MQKRFLIISSITSLILLVLIISLKYTEETRTEGKVEESVEKAVEDATCDRIKDYTDQYFRFVEDIKADIIGSELFGRDEISLYTSFIPEVGSFPVKEEIYENVAWHALQVITFFPEVNHFEYSILWGTEPSKQVMYLTIDKEAVKKLYNTYYSELPQDLDKHNTSFVNCFSSIEETDESKEWRERVDPDANLP